MQHSVITKTCAAFLCSWCYMYSWTIRSLDPYIISLGRLKRIRRPAERRGGRWHVAGQADIGDQRFHIQDSWSPSVYTGGGPVLAALKGPVCLCRAGLFERKEQVSRDPTMRYKLQQSFLDTCPGLALS